MGNTCVSSTKIRRKKSTMGDDYPDALDQDLQNQGPQLDIQLVVSNIQLKQPPSGIYGLKINIDGILEWNYEKVKITENDNMKLEIKEWKKERHMIIRASECSLKRMFLNFRLTNNEGVEVGVLALNMFLILTGPWRHDFPIKYSQNHMGRLTADIKCTQTISLSMAATKVQLNFINEHPGQMFHFTLKTEDLQGNCQQSIESYDVETFLYNKKRKYQVDGQGESATYRNRKTMILQNHKGLQWTNSISQRSYSKDLPCFNIPVKVDSISNYGFQFVLWKKSQEDADTFESYGQSNIPLSKLFWTDVKGSNLNPQVGGVRQIQIQEAVEFMGKKCGNMTIRCKVTTPKFFQQVLVFTRTQLGMTQVRSQTSSHISECDSIKKVRAIKENMLTTVWKSGNIKNELTEKGMNQFKEYRNAIYQDILRLERLFVQGDQNHPSFEYSSNDDMWKAQLEMIEIVEKFIPLTQLREVCISEATWRCMRIILFRGEFLLSKIGFTSDEIHQINTVPRTKHNKKMLQKINIAESYQALLLKLLLISLSKFGRKLLKQQFRFIFALCSICYFKIPEFRKQLLSVIQNINDEPRSYCFQNCHDKQSFGRFVDWQNLFSNPLKLYGANNSLLQQLKNTNNWKSILSKRNAYYFMLVQDLAFNANKIIGSLDTIKFWGVIPGYETLVGSFIKQMKDRKISQYPDALKDANMSFLQNECLLPIFIKIILEKTNTYDITCALKSIELIGAYFSNIQYKKKMLPSCFDTKLFYLAIKGIILSDNCFTIAKTLEILYLHFNIFSKNFKTQISMLLLGSSFFNLILNWSKIVRNIFIYLVIYRIIVWGKQKQVSDVINRWYQLKTTLQQCQQNKFKNCKQQITINYKKPYHQKMKNKLHFRRKQSNQQLVLKRRARSETFGTYSEKTQDTQYGLSNNSCVIFNQQPSSFKHTPPRRVKFSEELDLSDLKSINDFGAVRSVSEITDKKSSTRTRRVSCYSDFQINPITDKELVYVQVSKKQLIKIEEEFRVWNRVKNDTNDVPRVDIKVPIDEGDMRPDAIDN